MQLVSGAKEFLDRANVIFATKKGDKEKTTHFFLSFAKTQKELRFILPIIIGD